MKTERRSAGAAVIPLISIDMIEAAALSGKHNLTSSVVAIVERRKDNDSAEGGAMENQETTRLEEIEIGIVDAIRFTINQLLAFLLDSEKPATLKN